MVAKESKSAVPEIGRASHTDYGHGLLKANIIDESKKPFLLARVAVAQFGRPAFSSDGQNALSKLHETSSTGILQPPLSDGLVSEIDAFLTDRKNPEIGASNFAALVLLNMAIVESVQG